MVESLIEGIIVERVLRKFNIYNQIIFIMKLLHIRREHPLIVSLAILILSAFLLCSAGSSFIIFQEHNNSNNGTHIARAMESNQLPYVVGSQVTNFADSISLNFNASVYIYGYSTSGVSKVSPFVSGSIAVGVGANGDNNSGLAITKLSHNSYDRYYSSHYTIGGVGVSYNRSIGYTVFDRIITPPVQPSTYVNLTFSVLTKSLVVFAAMSGGSYYINLSGISNLKVLSILNVSGDTGLEFAYANLTAGQYTLREFTTNGDSGSNTRSEIISAVVFPDSKNQTSVSGVSNIEVYGIEGGIGAAVLAAAAVLLVRKRK